MRLNNDVANAVKGWGGRRTGAGRKPGENVRITLTLPRKLWLNLQREAASQHLDAEALVAQWLREKLGQQD